MLSSHHHLFHRTHLMRCLPILIYETYLLLSTSSLRVFQPSAHYAQDYTPYHQLSISASCTCLSQTKCTIMRLFIPHVNGFTIDKRSLVLLPPQIFFYITYYGLLRGVTSGFPATQWRLDERLPCDSRQTLKFTSHVSFLDWWRFCSIRSFLFSA